MYKKIVNLIYPNVCGFCGEKINERYTCRKCLNIIEYYKERVCLPNEKIIYCDKVICAFGYKGILKSKMLQFKFHNNKYMAKTFGEILSYKIKNHNIDADMIIPVPICKKRYFERGYNQSEYIAKYASEISNIKLEKNILLKAKNNLRQSDLNARERKENVKEAYWVKNKEHVKNKRIILIDDIFTTGATIDECSRVLKQSGASSVIAITVLYSIK